MSEDTVDEPFRAALADALAIAQRMSLRALLVGALARELCSRRP